MSSANGSKRTEVTRLLESAIMSGRLPAGARLPEIRLARELGVSQAIVREALLDLEGVGLVVKQANRSSHVIRLNSDDLVHIYQVRRELEPLAFALASAHLQEQTTATLQRCIDDMRAAAAREDFTAYSEADVRFHRTIWSTQPNRFLEKSLEAVCLPLFAYDRIGRASTACFDYERVARQHQIVLTALRTEAPERIAHLVRRLMQRWLRVHLADYVVISQRSEQSQDDRADLSAIFSS